MAGTIRKTVNITVTNDNGDNRQFSENPTIVQVGAGVDDRTHKVGSAVHEALAFPDITTKGTVGYENLSDVVIHIGIDVAGVFYAFASPGPGDVGSFTGSTLPYYAKAASGTDKEIRLFVCEA